MTDHDPSGTPPPGPAAGAGGTPGSASGTPGGTSGGADQVPPLTAFAWRTGLVRPTRGRLLAGVCGAIGRATNTDPVLWRVLIAVLAIFGGIGVVVYLLGWLLLPADGDTASPIEAVLGRGRSATSTVLTVIAAVVVLMSFGVLVSEPFRPGPWGVILVGGALLLLLRDRRRNPASATSVPPPPYQPSVYPPSATGAPMSSLASPTTTTTASQPPFAPYGPFVPPGAPPPVPPTPPAPPPPPKPKPPKSRLGRFVFSLLLIVVGGLALADLAGLDVPSSGYFAAALATIGVGLVIGAWFGRARGLIALGVVAALLLAMSSAVTHWRGPVGGGTVTWRPTSVELIQSNYQHDFGDATLDLREIDFARSTQPVNIDVRVDLGNLEVVVPENVDVTVSAKVDVGNAQIFDNQWGGLDPGARTVTDYGPDGKGGGELLITANVDLGNLEVHR